MARIIGFKDPTLTSTEPLTGESPKYRLRLVIIALGITVFLSLLTMTQPLLPSTSYLLTINQFLIPFGLMVMSLISIIFTEQIFRNTPISNRWSVKFFCISVGLIFSYDFLMYSHAVLFKAIRSDLWEARGIINVILIPSLLIGAIRNAARPLQLSMSRRFIFHSSSLFGASLYLIFIAIIGTFFKEIGGEWGGFLQLVIFMLAALALLLLLASGGIRAKLRVWISRNFFSYHYDYREEWVRFNETITDTESGQDLPARCLTAVAQLVESVGGALWLKDEHKQLSLQSSQAIPDDILSQLTAPDTLIPFWENREWIININEYSSSTEEYHDLVIPDSIVNHENFWLILPLFLHQKLVGCIILCQPRTPITLTWEHYDLLKVATRHAASYLSQYQAAKLLNQANQFRAVNQTTAFLVHDIKTMISQLSLMVQNAEKHKHNPAFIDDMINTTDHTVKKMQHILQQLKESHSSEQELNQTENDQSSSTQKQPSALVKQALNDILNVHQHSSPTIDFTCDPGIDEQTKVAIDQSKLSTALNHLVQNALESTPDSGKVALRATLNGDQLNVIVQDSGFGMSKAFIETQLFSPFESTKGLTGMGIGAYQSREIIKAAGGNLAVDSTLGEGSIFTVTLPICNP